MKFSVIMSVYIGDSGKHFQRALNSVSVEQTLRPSQIVIVKDGPVNPEIERIISICSSKASDINFTIIKKDINEGLASALNLALEVCDYDWVARMDSDDISVPNRFEKQVTYILRNSDISVLGANIQEFYDDELKLKSKRVVKCRHVDIIKMAKTRTPMNHVSVFYKKADVKSVGGYSENFGKLEDYKLWIDLIIAGKIFHNLSDVLVLVRTGNGFIERRSNRREVRDWDMLQKYLINMGIIGKLRAQLNRGYIRMFIYMPPALKKLLYKTILRKR